MQLSTYLSFCRVGVKSVRVIGGSKDETNVLDSNPLKITTLHNYWLGSNFLVLVFRISDVWSFKKWNVYCSRSKITMFGKFNHFLTFVQSLLLVLTYYFGTKVAMNQKQNMSVSAALLTT